MKTSGPLQRSSDQHGLSLVEMMIILSVIGTMIAGSVQFMGRHTKNQVALRAMAGRDALRDRLKLVARFPPNLAASLSRNPALVACLSKREDGQADCLADDVDDPQPFTLVLSVRGADAAQSPILAGPESAPARYDTNGQPCETPSATCQFAASVAFRAACPEGEKKCDRASHFEFFITVRAAQMVGAATGQILAPAVASVRIEAAQMEAAALEYSGADASLRGSGHPGHESGGLTSGIGQSGAAGRPSLRKPSRGTPPFSSSDGSAAPPSPVPPRGRAPRNLGDESRGVQALAPTDPAIND